MSGNMGLDTAWPFDVDISALDTSSITNIILDIESHLTAMNSESDLLELLRVKKLFEDELMATRRLH